MIPNSPRSRQRASNILILSMLSSSGFNDRASAGTTFLKGSCLFILLRKAISRFRDTLHYLKIQEASKILTRSVGLSKPITRNPIDITAWTKLLRKFHTIRMKGPRTYVRWPTKSSNNWISPFSLKIYFNNLINSFSFLFFLLLLLFLPVSLLLL